MKNLLITILVITILLLVLGWWRSSRNWNREKGTFTVDLKKTQKLVQDTRDSAGREISVFQVQAIGKDQLHEVDSAEKEELNYQLKQAHLKLKNVHSTVTFEQVTHDTTSIAVHDTLKFGDTVEQSVNLESSDIDTFIHFTGIAHFKPYPKVWVFKDMSLDYTIKTGATVTWADRSKFLHRSQLELELTETNPKSTTYGVRSYYITPDKQWYQTFWFHFSLGVIGTLVVLHYLH